MKIFSIKHKRDDLFVIYLNNLYEIDQKFKSKLEAQILIDQIKSLSEEEIITKYTKYSQDKNICN
jgi:hypothetical protein